MVALGMEALLTLFGSFIGFGMYHWQAASPWAGVSAWTAIWFLVTAGWSMFFGAWCAARLSGNPIAGDAVLHGIATWGLTTVATMAILAVASFAVLREGINVLGTATLAAEQAAPAAMRTVPPREATRAVNEADRAVSEMKANAGAMGQATADIISKLSFRIWIGMLVGFITAILGGLAGRSRPVIVGGADTIPLPTRRVA
jgi:hypothetical protein